MFISLSLIRSYRERCYLWTTICKDEVEEKQNIGMKNHLKVKRDRSCIRGNHLSKLCEFDFICFDKIISGCVCFCCSFLQIDRVYSRLVKWCISWRERYKHILSRGSVMCQSC